ncbi:MAG: methylmalonyl-CoA epimerase [Acidimicrobiia bacterium]|nr:MAG: methylmalonyl-CoA epimerase [Acidimicrobiia bacterium]
MYGRIDHVGIVVSDLSEAVRWYQERFDWEIHHQEYLDDVGVHLAYLLPTYGNLEGGATSLQIVQPVDPGPVLDHLRTKGDGLHHVCFEVADMSKALSQLGEDPDGVFLGGRDRLACFLQESPTGVLIELIGPAPDAFDMHPPSDSR